MSYTRVVRAASSGDLNEVEIEQHDAEMKAKVMQRKVNWDTYLQSELLSKADHGLLQELDGQELADQHDIMDEKGQVCAAMFVNALDSIGDKPAVQYLLTMVDQLLHDQPSHARFFHAIQDNPYSPFMRVLSRGNDSYSTFIACDALTVLLGTCPEAEKQHELGQFMKWLITRVNQSSDAELVHALTALKDVLKLRSAHSLLVDNGGLRALTNLLHNGTQNKQVLYLAAFCAWLLSFNEGVHAALREHEIVRHLVGVARLVVREKVVRMCCSTLKNLLGRPHFNEDMIAHGFVKVLKTLGARQDWKDQDLVSDIARIHETLSVAVEALSNMEMFVAQLDTGILSWTPVHSEKFWRENCHVFDDDNFAMIRKLIALLDGEDEVTLQVACYDLGEFARFHEDGKRVIQQLGGKARLMRQMNSAHPKVAKQALLAVQKLLVTNWEVLTKSSE